MNKPLRMSIWASAATMALAIGSAQAAPIVFDDFNADEGHFNLAPNFSGTTVGESNTSTADRTTAEAREGEGSQQLVLVHDGGATNFRLRHLSGSGSVANNTSFATTSGTDGFIGFWLKTTESGWKTTIALDDADSATIANMDGGVQRDVIGDGEWHLYEWDLDLASDWTSVPGIGGTSPVTDGNHTIDSVMLLNGTDTSGVGKTFFFDFLALNPDGSVADITPAPIPEPASMAVLGLAAIGMLRRRRR